jgi:hypothetical protein
MKEERPMESFPHSKHKSFFTEFSLKEDNLNEGSISRTEIAGELDKTS